MHLKTIKKIRNLSLKTKFILLIVVLGVIPILAVLFLLLNSLIKTSVNVENETLEQTLDLVKQEALNTVEAKAEMYNMALKHLIIDLTDIKEEIGDNNEKTLSKYRLKHQIVSRIFFLNASDNTVIASPAARNENLNEIKRTMFLQEEYKNSYVGVWSSPYWDSEMNANIISYIAPIHKADKFYGIIGFDITLEDFFNEIVSIDPSQSSYFFIIKNDGNIITLSKEVYNDFKLNRNEEAAIFDSPLSQENNFNEIFSATGKKEGFFMINEHSETNQKLVAFSMIPSLSARIIVVSPTNEIIQIQKEKAEKLREGIKSIGIRSTIISCIIVIVVILLFFLFAETNIVQPILKLQEGIDNLEKGDEATKIPIKHNDEIGRVTASFNQMSEELAESKKKLKEYNKNLEKKIEQRTEELNKKNKELEKFNQFAVNRELKIIELKKELDKKKDKK